MDADAIGEDRGSPGEEKGERASGGDTPGDKAKVRTDRGTPMGTVRYIFT